MTDKSTDHASALPVSDSASSGTTAEEVVALRQQLSRAEAECAALRRAVAETRASWEASACLRDVVLNSPVVAIRWRMEPGWPVEYVSANIERYGYLDTELLSGAVALGTLLEPTDRMAELVDERADGPHRLLSFVLRLRDGEHRLVRMIARTTKDAAGRVICEGLMRESTQTLHDDERVRLLEQAINTTHNGIVIADARAPDHPIIFANGAVTQISGYAPEEFIGRNCRFLQGEDRDQPALDVVRRALLEHRRIDAVLRNYRKDGTPFWNEVRISPVTNKRGEVTHFIGVQADITARKNAEASLARRDAILEAVSVATETLLRNPDYEKALPAALQQIGAVTRADHLCVWREQATLEGRTLNLAHAWFGDESARRELREFRDIPWESSESWPSAALLRQGKWLQGGVEDCTVQERALLSRLGVKSFLCLPIFEGPEQFWGLLTLGGIKTGLGWAPIEVEALLAATRVLGAVIHHRTMATALQASEQRFRSLVSNLKEVVFQTDARGNWTYLNRAWTEVTGFELEDSIGHSFLLNVHPDDRERNNRLFAPLIERKKEYCRHQVRYITKAGGYRWIEVFARLSLDESGAITGTAGTLTDVSERVAAEETQRRHLAAIEAAIDGVAILTSEGMFSFVNSSHVALFGYASPADLLGRNWRMLYEPATIASMEQQVITTLRANGTWSGTLRARRRDGTPFDEELSLRMIEGGDVVCVCRDITDRLRTAERIEQSLQEKEVMLKEIHHRVKNNMQIVSSLLSLQLERVRTDEMRALFVDAQNRIASMALVHEKLYRSADLARINLCDYLGELTDNLVAAQGARTRGITFTLECGDVDVTIDTAIPCGLIINELVSNAYKHAFPQGGPGTVALRLKRAGPGLLSLEVSDSGCGVPPELDLRRTHSLGMQLVHTLVQQLRGSLELRRGAGTHFLLQLHETSAAHARP